MRLIPNERINNWQLEAVRILFENGGRYRIRDLVSLLESRLDLTPYEKSLSISGQIRWLTAFRFRSIGLVKAGIVKKEKGFWKLGDNISSIIPDIAALTSESLSMICREKYQAWKVNRNDGLGEVASISTVETVTFEPPTNTFKIEPKPIEFSDILYGVDKSIIQIPPFQREFVWNPKDICHLLDSIYLGYPIGSFIFWKTRRPLPHHRQIGGIKLKEPSPGTPVDYVLDGQQRITSLYAAVRKAKIEGESFSFYFNLTNGRFQSERTKELQTQIDSDKSRIPIEVLFVTEKAKYMQFINEFPKEQQNLLHNLYDRFDKYNFSAIYVLEEEPAEEDEHEENIKKIINIFSRINDTGKKLSVVAKMVARCWGENFDIREKFDEFYQDNPLLEFIREETLLQSASAILNQRRVRSRDILDGTDIENLEEAWEDIIEAFKLAIEFVTNKIRVKSFDYLPFEALLVPLTYFHFKQHNPSNSQIEQLQIWFWKACLSNRYGSTLESRIEEDCVQFDKILKGEIVDFNYQIDWETLKARLIAQDYNLRNAFCKTVLCLYSYMSPKSLKDGRDIDLSKAFSGYYKHHLHHFFPRNYLETNYDPHRGSRDSVVNIAFASAIVNIEMGQKSPSDYISEFAAENRDLNKILKDHLIDDIQKFGISTNDFGLFLEKRSEKIENKFRLLLGLKTKTDQEFEEEPSSVVDQVEIQLRTIIVEQLDAAYQLQFWDEAIPTDIKEAVERKVTNHIRSHPYDLEKVTSPQGRVNFLDIMDYSKIILSNWPYFSDVFKSKGELEKHFSALKGYRNGIKHNRELNEIERKNGEAAVLWFNAVLTSRD